MCFLLFFLVFFFFLCVCSLLFFFFCSLSFYSLFFFLQVSSLQSIRKNKQTNKQTNKISQGSRFFFLFRKTASSLFFFSLLNCFPVVYLRCHCIVLIKPRPCVVTCNSSVFFLFLLSLFITAALGRTFVSLVVSTSVSILLLLLLFFFFCCLCPVFFFFICSIGKIRFIRREKITLSYSVLISFFLVCNCRAVFFFFSP